MIVFWLIAGFMLLVALFLIIFPIFRPGGRSLLGRKQQNIAIAKKRLEELMAELVRGDISREQYTDGRAELEETLYSDLEGLEDEAVADAPRGRWAAAVVAIAFPALALWLYMSLGTPQAITLAQAQNTPSGTSPAEHPRSVEEMAQRLHKELQAQPDNLEGWLMLARTYNVMQRYSDATSILAKANDQFKRNPEVMVQYANALALSNNAKLAGKPSELIADVLTIDPQNRTGLWLGGVAAAQQGDYEKALVQWGKLEPLLKDEAAFKKQLQKLIAQAQMSLGIETPGSPKVSAAGNASPESPEKAIKVAVSLDASLSEQVQPGDALFIYARALSGPPMPLAVVRKSAADLPVETVLNDEMAMIPAMKLSGFSQVRIGARLSRTGNAIAQSGDLEGIVEPVVVGNGDTVKIIINRRVP